MTMMSDIKAEAPPIDPRGLSFGPVAADEWDRWVMAQGDSTPFHLNAWGEAVEAATGHTFLRLGARDADGALVGIVPLHFVISALFGKAAVSAGFAVDGGILARDQAVADALAEHIWQRDDVRATGTAELRGGRLPSQNWAIKADSYAGFSCDLAGDDEAQLLAIPRKQRAEVRKALAALDAGALTVATGNDDAFARDHYRVYAESVRNLGTPVFPRKLFDEVRRRFGADADIITVSDARGPVASVLSLYHKGAVMPYWGGGTFAARASRANELIYYKLMGHARERGCTRFDFGRSKVGTGAYAYKKNWGMAPVLLAYAKRTADGVEERDINPLSPKYQMKIKVWQKLPLWLANRIGPMIARGLG